MKYILFLAFEYKHYKKPAVIELFADDLLIDSIELKESIGRKNGEWKHPYETPENDPIPNHVLPKEEAPGRCIQTNSNSMTKSIKNGYTGPTSGQCVKRFSHLR